MEELLIEAIEIQLLAADAFYMAAKKLHAFWFCAAANENS